MSIWEVVMLPLLNPKPTRFGTFEIPKRFIEEYPNVVRQVMNDIIIVDARYRMDCDVIIYMGISDMFDEVQEGEYAPHYHLEFNINYGVRAVKY